MPRDNKTPLIQRIARQAHHAFKGFVASAIGGDDDDYTTGFAELVKLVTAVRAADLKIARRKDKPGPGPDAAGPPVTYMHICETEAFSMGVFLLRRGASIPLHDHPGMNGVLKVLYGKVTIRCFDRLEHDGGDLPEFDPPLPPATPSGCPRRSVLRAVGEYSETSGPCLLTPQRDNIHQIDALDGPAAFLDILAPPYDPEDGRDCHYYKVLRRAGAGGTEGGKPAELQHQEEEVQKEAEMWLLEVPQPEDFLCGGEPYPGPAVSV